MKSKQTKKTVSRRYFQNRPPRTSFPVDPLSGYKSTWQCRGQEFNPWPRKIPHALEQLRLWATAIKAVLWTWGARTSKPMSCSDWNPSALEPVETSRGYSLGGLMLRLKVQSSGHLMRSTDSLEKTLMLGKTAGRRRRGRQRRRRLHHRLDGHESEQAPGADDGQGGVASAVHGGRKELDMTERVTHAPQLEGFGYKGLESKDPWCYPQVTLWFRGWGTLPHPPPQDSSIARPRKGGGGGGHVKEGLTNFL